MRKFAFLLWMELLTRRGSDGFTPRGLGVVVPFSSSSCTTTTSHLTMAAKPLAETLLERLPSEQVIAVVDRTSPNPLVAADVAAAAGVPLGQARKDLMALAAVTQGDIAVDANGELLYKFPRNVRNVLAQKNFKYRVLESFRKVWPALFWLLRVSFGVALLASILLVFSTIFFLQSSSSSSSDDNRRRDDRGMMRGGGGGGMMWWGPSPFDVFYYRPYGYYAMPASSSNNSRARDPSEMGFLESVFSYIFGDGDPNAELETKRLQLASNVIRANNGAVTAEQLAPFCDPPDVDVDVDVVADDTSSTSTSGYVNENFVLPIVTALNGEARVTPDGDIIYVFPDLQVSADTSSTSSGGSSSRLLATTATATEQQRERARERSILKRAGLSPDASTRSIQQLLQYNRISTRGAYERPDLMRVLESALPPMTSDEQAELACDDPTVLQEREYKFSLASDLNKLLAGGLGVLNLGGALYLGNLLNQFALVYGTTTRLPTYMGTVQAFFPLLLAYAVLFNVIPLVRNFWIQQQNAQIQSRNSKRQQWASFLANCSAAKSSNSSTVKRKLLAASRMGTNLQQAGKDIIYDTSRPAEEVELQRQEQALQDFDQLLGKSRSSISDDDEDAGKSFQ